MSPSPVEGIQEAPAEGNNPPASSKPVHSGTGPKDDGCAEGENATKLVNVLGEAQSPGSMPKVLSYQPTSAIAAQPQSIWHKYVTVADQWDSRMREKWKTNMNNLLIFAALFTAIVTAFVLDAMSDLDEDTSTKLLRLLVEQQSATTHSTVEMPPSNPPSSILTVSSLWFMSIMSSLAATTWAILCLEWCAFLTDGVQAEDYEEMAEKRQRRFEAVKRWRMHLLVAAIPFFLHISLFLFLAGLWLRLRDVNKQLGLIVGVSSLVIASSYVIIILLPIFTDAPFSTSGSELIQPVVDGIKRIIELRHFIRPPRAVPWINGLLHRIVTWVESLLPEKASLPTITPFALPRCIPRLRIQRITLFAKNVYKEVELCIRAAWKTVALLPIIPMFGLDRNPFNELNKLKVGRSGKDKGIHLRALFWLMNTPLSKEEVMDILKEFKSRNEAKEEPLDRTIIRLLVLSLSSVLENNSISKDEQPIFDHCTEALAKEMDRAFENGEYNRRIPFRNNLVFGPLTPHFHLTTSSEDVSSALRTAQDYWSRAISALWLCPSQEILKDVVRQLDLDIRPMEADLLQRIIRGLHAATLVCSNSDRSAFEIIPDFDLWDWDSRSSNPGLNKALSSYLQGTFAAFFNTLHKRDRPITIPSLAADCLMELDNKPEQYPPECKLHSALCFFMVVTWRSDPQVFEEGPSFAHALLKSTESESDWDEDVLKRVVSVTRLCAIAHGPKPPLARQVCPLTRLNDLYNELPKSIKTDPEHLGGFLGAYAANLEAVLAVDGQLTAFTWLRSQDCVTARKILSDQLFTDDALDLAQQCPEHRLPYLYSLAIALPLTTEGRDRQPRKVAKLFITDCSQEKTILDRDLDTNILTVTVLRFTLGSQSDTLEYGKIKRFLELLEKIDMDWRMRWKSIYLITGLASLLSQMDDHQNDGFITYLIDMASRFFVLVEPGQAPCDWERKKKELKLCGLESRVKSIVDTQGERCEGVYEWSSRENVPYLALYNPRRTTREPVSRVAYWAVTTLQRIVSNEPAGPGLAVDDVSSAHKAQGNSFLSPASTIGPNDSSV